MSSLHLKASTGGFLPGVRETVLIDANMELNGLINNALSNLLPDESLGEERDFMLRGLLIRAQALANVMYAASCSADEDLCDYLAVAYLKHHTFVSTPAISAEGEAA